MFYVFGNWKMQVDGQEGMRILLAMQELCAEGVPSSLRLAVFPSAVFLDRSHFVVRDTDISLGVQNVSAHQRGAYTGQVSIEDVCSFVDYALLGHAEGRKYLQEEDEIVIQKALLCHKKNIKPVVCFGSYEHLDPLEQVKNLIDELHILKHLIVAYEPVSAIGTGEAISKKEIEFLVQETQKIGKEKDVNIQFLYGGSVNKDNIQQIIDAKVSGVLVGGVSQSSAKWIPFLKKTLQSLVQ